jgi:RNA polymerase sigma-70 factor (ECF subfamily)
MQSIIKATFDQILEENKVRIYRICKIYAVSPIEPEDLFQEVTLHVWRAFPTFEGRSNVSTWIYRIALNVCMNAKNKLTHANEKTIRLETIQFEPVASIPDISHEEKYKALHNCIHLLNYIDQSIVILSLDELSYKEIAKITGLTANHIAVKMRRIRKILLNCITTKLK